jgi:outer membrane biosynthesis protein TonB
MPRKSNDIGLVTSATFVTWMALLTIGLWQYLATEKKPPPPTSRPEQIVMAIMLNSETPIEPDAQPAMDDAPAASTSDEPPPIAPMAVPAGPALMAIAPAPPLRQRAKTAARSFAPAAPVYSRIIPGKIEGDMPDVVCPQDLVDAGLQGTVDIEFIVDVDGVIRGISFESSGYSQLDAATILWIQSRWHFPPGPRRYLEKSFTFVINGGQYLSPPPKDMAPHYRTQGFQTVQP